MPHLENSWREFAWPSKDTFSIPVLYDFVKRYHKHSAVSLDPFARNFTLATYRNDLNPNTLAEYHLDVFDFLKLMLDKLGERSVDLIIFDPPFSPRQLKESYEEAGKGFKTTDAWRTCGWRDEKALCNMLLKQNGVFLDFGWDNGGIMFSGYEILEVGIVVHGGGSNATLCMAQRKVVSQGNMFDINMTGEK